MPIKAELVRFSGLAFGGAAVGRLADGRVVFVPYGAPGDLAEVELTEQKRRFARGKLLRLEEPSPVRLPPPCPYFGECGGCQWQHVEYAAQLVAKQQIVEHALARPVNAIIPSPQAFAYRWRVRQHKEGGQLGYRAWASHRLVDVARCHLLPEAFDAAIQQARPELPARGELHALMGSRGTVALRCGTFTKGPPEVDLADAGEEPFWVRPGAFAQPGPAGNRSLRRLVEQGAQATGARVLELYAGVGNFTRGLARVASEVIAVEGDADAGGLFARNVPARATLVCAPVAREVQSRVQAKERFDVVVLDPPRDGAADVCPMLPALGPRRIVYVSCDPMTLARDLRTLEGGGYEVAWATPVDLMPQTYHVETVVLLTRGAE